MTAAPWPDHLLTLAEWDALPGDTFRHCELVEGVLIMVPAPAPLHQRAMVRLAADIDDQLPDELTALADVDVLIDAEHPVTVRAPDVVVTANKLAQDNPSRLAATDVLLAVEIVSPGTGRTDRVTKPAEYADAGIPNYWIVDLDDPPTLTAYTLVDGEYEVVAEVTDAVTLAEPVALRVDVRRLTSRR